MLMFWQQSDVDALSSGLQTLATTACASCPGGNTVRAQLVSRIDLVVAALGAMPDASDLADDMDTLASDMAA